MKKLFVLSMAFLLGLGLILVSGCSEDDENGLATGDPDDPNYEFVADIAGPVNFQMNTQMLELTFSIVDYLGSRATITPGQLTGTEKIGADYFEVIDYDTANYWHIVSCSVEVTDDDGVFFAYMGIDSLRLYDGSSYTYVADADVTEMDIHAHFHVNFEFSEDDETTSGSIGNHCLFDLDIIDYNDGEFTLDGHAYDSLDFEVTNPSGTCDLTMGFRETVTDLYIDPLVINEGYCPLDGSISLVYGISMACTGDDELSELDINGNWSASFEFDGGTVNFVYENDTYRWTGSDECRPIPVTSGFRRAIAPVR
ncbi:MAG: hypothetical protein JW763_11005 [candidate division Zixibacteria bacterium]|nr:hypothetical protein [candidate division Zixibacteria bacterium]